MKLLFTPDAWDDYLWWQNNERQTLKRVNRLLDDIPRNGYEGTGKPEPLSDNLSGFWSRRITNEHRVVYRIDHDIVSIVSCLLHYE